MDHQRRRDTRPITRLPRLPIAADRLPEIDGHPGRTGVGVDLDAAHARPSFTSPRPFIADRHVRAFDAAIDPETRLVLAESSSSGSSCCRRRQRTIPRDASTQATTGGRHEEVRTRESSPAGIPRPPPQPS